MKLNPLGLSLEETSAFYFDSLEDETRAFETGDYTYSRIGHPMVSEVETAMASLEEAEAALAFSSGMAAIATLLLAFGSGKRVLAQQDLYGGTRRLLTLLAEAGVLCVQIWRDIHPPASGSLPFDLAIVEIPTNPLLRVPDLSEWRALCASSGATLVVDATMATPFGVRPLYYGADLVVHSATKYLAGQDTLTGGFVCGPKDAIARLKEWRTYLGTIMTPKQAVGVMTGLNSLAGRVESSSATASWLADALAKHPAVARVYYPLEKSHPDYAVARRLLACGGGVLSFEIQGGADRVFTFVNSLKTVKIAATFGGNHPVITHPYTTSHRWISPEERAAMGISESLVRLSVGNARPQSLWEDLSAALSG